MWFNLTDDLPKCLPKICYQDGAFNTDKIPKNSNPLPVIGKYRYNWAAGGSPQGYGVCLEEVIVYHSGSGHCCDGWVEEAPKFPRRDNDVSPFLLPLCGDASRETLLVFRVGGKQ